MGHDLRLPVYLFIGRSEDEQPVQKSNYTQNLLNWLEKVRSYARQHLKMKSDKMKSHYDLQATGKELIGDAVWLYNPQWRNGVSSKLSQPWQGPYVVTKKINDPVYRMWLRPRQKTKVVHWSRLWAYSGKHPPTWHFCQTQSPTRRRIAIRTGRWRDNWRCHPSTSLKQSSRVHRPPARYDPSNKGGESVMNKTVTNTDSHIYIFFFYENFAVQARIHK